MPVIPTDAELTEMRAEAIAECRRCQGREHGDCDSACRYWPVLATTAEREEARKRHATWNRRTHRWWVGPVACEGWREGETSTHQNWE